MIRLQPSPTATTRDDRHAQHSAAKATCQRIHSGRALMGRIPLRPGPSLLIRNSGNVRREDVVPTRLRSIARPITNSPISLRPRRAAPARPPSSPRRHGTTPALALRATPLSAGVRIGLERGQRVRPLHQADEQGTSARKSHRPAQLDRRDALSRPVRSGGEAPDAQARQDRTAAARDGDRQAGRRSSVIAATSTATCNGCRTTADLLRWAA